jgi:hypothetical protein
MITWNVADWMIAALICPAFPNFYVPLFSWWRATVNGAAL